MSVFYNEQVKETYELTIGQLALFRDDDDHIWQVGRLTAIFPDMVFPYSMGHYSSYKQALPYNSHTAVLEGTAGDPTKLVESCPVLWRESKDAYWKIGVLTEVNYYTAVPYPYIVITDTGLKSVNHCIPFDPELIGTF